MPANKQEAIEIGRAKVREYMDLCGSWAQSTVLALQDALGLENDAIARAATAMTGGIGGQADSCGSLIGSSMILGMMYGIDKDTVEDTERMVDCIMRTGAFYQWFVNEHGSPTCRDIVTRFGNGVFYDMGDPEQLQKATELGIVEKCDQLVETTIAHVIDTIWDDVQTRK